MRAPNCAQQRARLLSLQEWGAELRQWGPQEGQCACLHAKFSFLDGEAFLLGFANAMRNGLERNFEISVRIKGSDTLP